MSDPIAEAAADTFTLAHLTSEELEALAVARDEQANLGPGRFGARPANVRLVPTRHYESLLEWLQIALREINEHNSESKYHTGRDLENTLRLAAGLEALPRYDIERHNSSHY